MGRTAGSETNKREDIIAAAESCFLEQGFDGTSVRTIMKKAGAEIGLFYYYFKSKDAAFDIVLDRFFAGYESDFARIVEHGRRNPCRVTEDFFEYMERETAAFREKYARKMHRTVRWAIREHTLTLIEPYLRQVVEIQSAYYGVRPPIAPEVAALYLTHGVGSAILHEDEGQYFRNRPEIKRGISLLMGMPMDEQELRIPLYASPDDIPCLMELVRETRGGFPGLDEADFRSQLPERMARSEVLIFRSGDIVAAALLFSAERREIDYLSVSPKYRRRGLARKLVETAAARLPVGAELSVVTYRDGDPSGESARGFYSSMGFAERGELTMFGYPCRRLSVEAPDAPLGARAAAPSESELLRR